MNGLFTRAWLIGMLAVVPMTAAAQSKPRSAITATGSPARRSRSSSAYATRLAARFSSAYR